MLTFNSKPNMIFVIEERMEIIPSEFFSLDRDTWGSQLQAPWPACRWTEEGELTFRKVDATEPKPQENQGKGKEGAGISPGVSPALRDTSVMFFRALGFVLGFVFVSFSLMLQLAQKTGGSSLIQAVFRSFGSHSFTSPSLNTCRDASKDIGIRFRGVSFLGISNSGTTLVVRPGQKFVVVVFVVVFSTFEMA